MSTPNYIHTLTTADGVSDNFTVITEIKFKHNPVDSKCNIVYRYTPNIDIVAFKNIGKSKLITIPKADLS